MTLKVKVVKPSRGNLVLRWTSPDNGRVCEKSAGTMDRREAERQAGKLQDDLENGRHAKPSRMLWADFRTRYEAEKMATLARGTQGPGKTALDHFERIINPKYLANATTQTVSRFQAELRKPREVIRGDKKIIRPAMATASLLANLAHLRAALSWAHHMGLLPQMPRIDKPTTAKGQRLMRGRPLATEEFERMLTATETARPHDADAWQRFLTGLWLSGLRLGEALKLSWESDTGFHIDLSGVHPQLRIWAEAEKGRRDRKLPLTPDFAQWLLQTPEADRFGLVFPISTAYGPQMTDKRVCRAVSAAKSSASMSA